MSHRIKTLIPAGILIGFCLLLFLPLPDFVYGDPARPSSAALLDALHFPFFIVVTGCIFVLLLRPLRKRGFGTGLCLGVTVALAILFAVVSEWIQSLAGRSASLTDFRNDVLGIATFAGVTLLLQRRKRIGIALTTLAAILMLSGAAWLAAAPVFSALNSESAQVGNFPDLGGFESSHALMFWKPQGESNTGGKTAISLQSGTLRIDSIEAPWSGVSILTLDGTRDWSSKPHLVIGIRNTGEPFVLGLRVDTAEKKFSRTLKVEEGDNTFRLPLSDTDWAPASIAPSHCHDIRKIVLHAGETGLAATYFLTDIYLD